MKKLFLAIVLVFGVLFLSSCSIGGSDDIINPDADYVYFYGKTCPHCQELNAFMKDNNTHDNYAIEKREVYFNPENAQAFQAVIKALGLEQGSTGVPFMLRKSDNTHYIGVEPIKAILP